MTLHVSLIVCPIFVVQSDNRDSNTGGPVDEPETEEAFDESVFEL